MDICSFCSDFNVKDLITDCNMIHLFNLPSSIDDLITIMSDNKSTFTTTISTNDINISLLHDLDINMKWIHKTIGHGGCTVFLRCYHTKKYVLYTYGLYWKNFTDSYYDDELGFILIQTLI